MERLARLRQVNAVLSALLMLAFVSHAVSGGLYLVGVLAEPATDIAHIMEGLCWLHVFVGIYLTYRSAKALHESGELHAPENRRFWAVRISGILIAVLMLMHIIGFAHAADPRSFPIQALIVNLLLVAVIAVHVICNVRPLRMSLGFELRSVKSIAAALAGLLVLLALAFLLTFVQRGVV